MSLVADCFSCKTPVEISEPQYIRTANDRLRLAGKCINCGKNVSRFVADPEKPQLTKEQKKEREAKRREERKSLPVDPLAVKKTPKKRSLKQCSNCVCAQHQAIIAEQPKKKHRVSLKEKREKEIERLKEELRFLKGESSSSEEDMPRVTPNRIEQ